MAVAVPEHHCQLDCYTEIERAIKNQTCIITPIIPIYSKGGSKMNFVVTVVVALHPPRMIVHLNMIVALHY